MGSLSPERKTGRAAATEGDRRILNLLFSLNASRGPLTTSQIIDDPDLGYGSKNEASDKRKFSRDREKLAEQGVHIREIRPSGASPVEESSWEIDRERTHAARDVLSSADAETLLDAIDAFLSRPDIPFRPALDRVRSKVAMVAGENQADQGPFGDPGEPKGSDPVLDAIWQAFLLRKNIQISYGDAHGERSRRTLAVYGIFTLDGRCYVVGLDGSSGEIRTFRADRIQRVFRSKGTYEVPTSFDVGDYLFLPFDFTEGDGVPATFSFPTTMGTAEISQISRGRGELKRENDGSWRWTVLARDLDAAACFGLQHASRGMCPVSPPSLLDSWGTQIKSVVRAHGA